MSVVLSHRTTQVDAVFNCLSGGAKDPGLASCHGVDCSSFWWNESFMEKPTFTRACLSDVRVTIEIVCSCGGAAISGGDGTDPSTQVHVVRYVWVPVAMSYHVSH
jgi:hypothetical protein